MKPSEGGKTRENPEPGSYQFRFISVIDYGTQKVEFNGKPKDVHQVNIGYELLDGDQTSEGENFCLYQKYTLSSNKKAILMQHLSGWLGKPAGDLDLEEILGKYGNVNVVHNPSKDGSRIYANIASLTPLKKTEKPAQKGKEPLVYFSLKEGEFDRDVFDSLQDWQQTIIAGTKEFAAVDEDKPKRKKK